MAKTIMKNKERYIVKVHNETTGEVESHEPLTLEEAMSLIDSVLRTVPGSQVTLEKVSMLAAWSDGQRLDWWQLD